MASVKVLAALELLCGIAYCLWPWPRALTIYNKLLFLLGTFVDPLKYWWPGPKALRALPLAFRLLLAGFLAFLAFMDIKTSGSIGFTLIALVPAMRWGEFLWPKPSK